MYIEGELSELTASMLIGSCSIVEVVFKSNLNNGNCSLCLYVDDLSVNATHIHAYACHSIHESLSKGSLCKLRAF